MGKTKNTFNILVKKPFGQLLYGRLCSKWMNAMLIWILRKYEMASRESERHRAKS